MKHVLALAFATVPTLANADCASETAFFSAAVQSRGYVIDAIGEVVEADGKCTIQSIAFQQENVVIDIAEMVWNLQGLEALSTGAGLLSFDATLTDLRISPRTPDRWISYLLSEQNRRNTIDATFSASWDLTAERLEITTLDIDLPGDNRVAFEQSISGATTSLLTGNPAALQAVSLDHMALLIENRGFADSLILGPLVARLSEIPGAPETVIEGTKRDFRALVSNLPGDVFDDATKTALVALINAGPAPWGVLDIEISANPAISLAPFFAAAGQNITPDSISTLFQGGTLSITFLEDTGEN